MYGKQTFRSKGGLHEKPTGRAAQAARNQTGGTGKRTGGIPANHRLIGKWTVQPIHSFGLQNCPVLSHDHRGDLYL